MELPPPDSRKPALKRVFSRHFANTVGIEGASLTNEEFIGRLDSIYDILCASLPRPNWDNIQPVSPWFDQTAIRSRLRKYILDTRLRVYPSDPQGGPGIFVQKRLTRSTSRTEESLLRNQYLIEWPRISSEGPLCVRYYPYSDSGHTDGVTVFEGSFAWEHAADLLGTAHLAILAAQAGEEAVRQISRPL